MLIDPPSLLSAADRQRAAEIRFGVPIGCVPLVQDWCAACGVPFEMIAGERRLPRVVEARDGLAWLLHRRAGMGLSAIARALGGRDRTTIRAAIAREDARRGVRA